VDVACDQERPYHSDSTASRPLCEVKHCRARLVLRWGTTLESRVLFFCRNQQPNPTHSMALFLFAQCCPTHKLQTTYPCEKLRNDTANHAQPMAPAKENGAIRTYKLCLQDQDQDLKRITHTTDTMTTNNNNNQTHRSQKTKHSQVKCMQTPPTCVNGTCIYDLEFSDALRTFSLLQNTTQLSHSFSL
jgi:hypothetical protein